jgi:hypothetical protein
VDSEKLEKFEARVAARAFILTITTGNSLIVLTFLYRVQKYYTIAKTLAVSNFATTKLLGVLDVTFTKARVKTVKSFSY